MDELPVEIIQEIVRFGGYGVQKHLRRCNRRLHYVLGTPQIPLPFRQVMERLPPRHNLRFELKHTNTYLAVLEEKTGLQFEFTYVPLTKRIAFLMWSATQPCSRIVDAELAADFVKILCKH